MTKVEFLARLDQYRYSGPARDLILNMKFAPEELDLMMIQVEKDMEFKAEYLKKLHRMP